MTLNRYNRPGLSGLAEVKRDALLTVGVRGAVVSCQNLVLPRSNRSRFTMNLLIRIARPTDLDAVGSLLAASYSGLLATHYDDDLLGARRISPKRNRDLLACDITM
jgi:hypothetical protein